MTDIDILYVISSLAVGGSERHLSAISRALAGRGRRVAIDCLFAGGPLVEPTRAGGVEVIVPDASLLAAGQARRALAMPHHIASLARLIRRRRPGVVHFFGPPAYLAGGLAAVAARAPRLVYSRRSLNDYQAKHPLLARIERRLHRRMAAVLGNSAAVVDQLRDEGVDPDRLALIYNGTDLAPFGGEIDRRAVRAGLGTGADDLVMVILANLIPYKGHADLLAGLAAVRDRLPHSWKLWIVGRDDGHGAELARLGEEHSLTPHLRFLGLRQDAPDLLRSADIAVSSSHEEGFSNSVLEAMAAGLPVVATAAGGNAEAIEDGTTGSVVPVRDAAAIGAALARLAGDRSLATRMGKAGRARVEARFSLPACVAQYEALYGAIRDGAPLPREIAVRGR